MKKILLATTILSMSAGFAAADISWTGSAAAGIAREGRVESTPAAAVAAVASARAELADAQDALDAIPEGEDNTAALEEVEAAQTKLDKLLDSPAYNNAEDDLFAAQEKINNLLAEEDFSDAKLAEAEAEKAAALNKLEILEIGAARVAARKALNDAYEARNKLFGTEDNPKEPTSAELTAAQDKIAAARSALNAIQNGTAAVPTGGFRSYSTATLAVAFSGSTDGGLTFGASMDLSSGRSYTLADDDGFANEGAAFGMPTVFIAGSFGKISFSTNNIDGFDGDEANDGLYDVQYDGTFGPVAVGVLADMESGLMAVSAAFSTGALALSANYTQDNVVDDIYNVSATYTLGMIAITAATDDQSDASIGVAYAGTNGIAASATYNTNTGGDDASFDITAGYTANSLAIAASVDNVSGANGGDPTWTVTAAYDLGGGLTIEAGTNYTQDVMIGASMAF